MSSILPPFRPEAVTLAGTVIPFPAPPPWVVTATSAEWAPSPTESVSMTGLEFTDSDLDFIEGLWHENDDWSPTDITNY